MAKKTQKIAITARKAWRVRLYVTFYLTVLIIALGPIPVVHAPIFEITNAKAEPLNYKDYAKWTGQIEYNWGKDQYICLVRLWGKESAWNPEADNPHSTAFGIAQMLNEESDNGYVQISNGLRYIEHRYTNPCNAWQFWQRNNWY